MLDLEFLIAFRAPQAFSHDTPVKALAPQPHRYHGKLRPLSLADGAGSPSLSPLLEEHMSARLLVTTLLGQTFGSDFDVFNSLSIFWNFLQLCAYGLVHVWESFVRPKD